MLLERGEVDQIAVQRERGHFVADLLLRLRRRFSDREPDLFQDRLDIRREGRDVVIDGGGYRASGHAVASFDGLCRFPIRCIAIVPGPIIEPHMQPRHTGEGTGGRLPTSWLASPAQKASSHDHLGPDPVKYAANSLFRTPPPPQP